MCSARTPTRYTLMGFGFKRSAKKATNKERVFYQMRGWR